MHRWPSFCSDGLSFFAALYRMIGCIVLKSQDKGIGIESAGDVEREVIQAIQDCDGKRAGIGMPSEKDND